MDLAFSAGVDAERTLVNKRKMIKLEFDTLIIDNEEQKH